MGIAWEAQAFLGLGFGLTATKGLQKTLGAFQDVLQAMHDNCTNLGIPTVRRMSEQVL